MPSPGPLEYIIIIAMIVLIVVVARTRSSSEWRVGCTASMPATTPPRDPAMDALRTRLANGEIDDAEYQRLRTVLQGH